MEMIDDADGRSSSIAASTKHGELLPHDPKSGEAHNHMLARATTSPRTDLQSAITEDGKVMV